MKYLYKVDFSKEFYWFIIPKQIKPVDIFLACDISSDADNATAYIELLDNILLMKKKSDSTGGNACGIDVEKEFTRVEDFFPPDDDPVVCYIETEELRKLIILWMTEVEKFSKIKQNTTFKSLDPEYKIYCFLASIYHQFVDNFDLVLDQYLASETVEFRAQLIAAIEQFLQSNESVETKNEYIKLCADSVDFEQLKIAPVAWLEIILLYIKNNKNCSQNAKNTVST